MAATLATPSAAGAASPGRARAAANAPFSITTNPPLVPAFNPANQDYVVRCTQSATGTTQVTTTGGRSVVAGKSFPGPVNLYEPLVAGQGLVVRGGGQNYYIRCLPADFPNFTSVVSGQPQANGYLVTFSPYTVAFDSLGVPVWWYRDAALFTPFDAKFFGAPTIGWSEADNHYVLRGLNGSLQATIGGGANPLDFHDLQRLSNGNYLGIMDVTTNCPAVPSQCVDLSSWGLSPQSSIVDNEIVEVTPGNQIVWSWSVAQHIDVAQANVNWRDQYPDVIHMNSVLYDGHGGIIFSARHLDAVYRINMKTGAVTWKLGGSPTPQSLTVTGNQYPALFSGQHFARLDADGTLTVHDNGTRAGRAPRAMRFSLDTTAMTATVVEQVTDSRVSTAACCGSAAKLPTGDWVMSWGANPVVTELTPSGTPVLTILASTFSYRVEPLGASVGALRNGMDAMTAPLNIAGDLTPPTTAVVLPGNGTTVSGSTWLDAAASDNVGVTDVEFRFSGNGYNNQFIETAAITPYGWVGGWDTTAVPNGTYTLTSVAYDAAGNAGVSPPITVTVAN